MRAIAKLLAAGGLSVFLGLVMAAPADSQAPEEAVIGGGFFQVGYLGLDANELNTSLTSAGYPSLNDDFLTMGGGIFGNHGRFLFGAEGHAVHGQDETSADGLYHLSLDGGFGLLRAGYLAFSRDGLDVFPTVGVGGGSLGIAIADRSAPTFDDVLGSPGRSSRLSTGMFLIDASIVANYRIDTASDEEEEREGVLLGLQVGYTFAPGDTSWDLDEINNVAGGPQFQIEGLHIGLSLGGWGEEEREE